MGESEKPTTPSESEVVKLGRLGEIFLLYHGGELVVEGMSTLIRECAERLVKLGYKSEIVNFLDEDYVRWPVDIIAKHRVTGRRLLVSVVLDPCWIKEDWVKRGYVEFIEKRRKALLRMVQRDKESGVWPKGALAIMAYWGPYWSFIFRNALSDEPELDFEVK